MEVKELSLSQTDFLNDYLMGKSEVNGLIDYPIQDSEVYQKRMTQLSTREFKREELVKHLLSTHQHLPFPDEVIENIHKLRDPSSLTVVGGQQAGLLTGPLYTVYKAISVILLAKQQEEALAVPVVPVFWVAGEDHDLEEIRYVYKQKNPNWTKHVLHDQSEKQKAASDTELSQESLTKWIDELFETFPETAYTRDLVQVIYNFSKQSRTYVDFFILMMNWLFEKEGLVLLDSNDHYIRKIETDYFVKMIEQVTEIQEAQQRGVHEFMELGYGQPIQTEPENAHLFIQLDGERKRLDFVSDSFQVKGTDTYYTKNELLNIAKQTPERLSNNVVSRPLMQEFLLPVLAFVSGPGELAYWATLKHVFRTFSLKMPPVVPRLQLTVVPRDLRKWIERNGYSCEQFIMGQGEQIKEAWLAHVNEHPIDDVMQRIKSELKDSHQPVQELAERMDPMLYQLSQKNFTILQSQLEFIEKKMNRFVEQKHYRMLSKFDETSSWLFPLNRLQERVIHPVVLLNLIGKDGLRRFIDEKIELDGTHKLFFL